MSEMALLKYGVLTMLGIGTATIGWSYVSSRSRGVPPRIAGQDAPPTWLSGIARGFIVFFIVGFLVGFYSIYIEPNWIEIHHVRIHDSKLAHVLGNTKIVQITDIHLNEGLRFRERELIKKVNALRPDIIFITGDLFDDATQIAPAKQLINSLKAKLGIYGIAGDTDHIVMDGASMAREFIQTKFDVLINENRRIPLPNGNFLWILGLDAEANPVKIGDLLADIPDHVPKILLAEAPDVFEEAEEFGIQLALVGDTHGGQIGIPLLIHMSEYANRTPYMKGLFTKGKTKMFVNRGIGTKTLPIRFLCRPEIAVIEVTE